jgi:hypothetical protein
MFLRAGRKKRQKVEKDVPIVKESKCVKKLVRNAIENVKKEIAHRRILSTKILDDTCVAEEELSLITSRQYGFLRDHLKFGGNGVAWSNFIKHINKPSSSASLVWGPTGSGKTHGIKDCASACGLRVYEIEPSSTDGLERTKVYLNSITSSKTLLGPRLILIDVIEGFDQEFVKIFESFLAKDVKFSIPVVFVADSIYNFALKKLFSLIPEKIRLFKPYPERCTSFAQMTFASNIDMRKIQKESELCDGNLRILKRSLIHKNFCSADEYPNLFVGTTDLLLKKSSIDIWEKCGDRSSIQHLIFDNYLSWFEDLSKISDLSDFMGEKTELNNYAQHIYEWGMYLRLYANEFTHDSRMTMNPKLPKKVIKRVNVHQDYLDLQSRLFVPECLAKSHDLSFFV